jgi:hypothetical protein
VEIDVPLLKSISHAIEARSNQNQNYAKRLRCATNTKKPPISLNFQSNGRFFGVNGAAYKRFMNSDEL